MRGKFFIKIKNIRSIAEGRLRTDKTKQTTMMTTTTTTTTTAKKVEKSMFQSSSETRGYYEVTGKVGETICRLWINHFFLSMRLWKSKQEQRTHLAVQVRIVLRAKILLIIYLHPNLICLPSCHNRFLMESLPLKGAGVIGTNSSVKELTLPLAISHLSSPSPFYCILQVPGTPLPTGELHPGLLPGDKNQDCTY